MKASPSPRASSWRVARKCQEFSFPSFSPSACFYPVIPSLRQPSPPSVFSAFAFVLKSLCPLLQLVPPPLHSPSSSLGTYAPLSPLSLPSGESSQVSAVTASAQGLMVCNTLPAPLCRSGGPFIYRQRERGIISVCVHEHVPVRV